jgi:hypothetical protein
VDSIPEMGDNSIDWAHLSGLFVRDKRQNSVPYTLLEIR